MKLTLWRVPLCALGALAATAILIPNSGPESGTSSAAARQSNGMQQLPQPVHTASWQAVFASTGR